MPKSFGVKEYTALRPVQDHVSNGSLSAAVSIAVPESATLLLIQAISKNVRVTIDASTTATATVGFQVTAGTAQYFPVGATTSVSVIEESASATIQYQFFE
jgi:hypothetical protein